MVIVKPQKCIHCGHIFMSFVGGFVWSAPFPQHCPKCGARGKEIPGMRNVRAKGITKILGFDIAKTADCE